jgi:hypothetical protein
MLSIRRTDLLPGSYTPGYREALVHHSHKRDRPPSRPSLAGRREPGALLTRECRHARSAGVRPIERPANSESRSRLTAPSRPPMRGKRDPALSSCIAAEIRPRASPQPALSTCGRTCRLRPAPKICGSPSLSGNCLWCVPWFHENALLQVDGRDDDLADDGAGCAAGDKEV